MPDGVGPLLSRCFSLDLEVGVKDQRIRALAGVRPDTGQSLTISVRGNQLAAALAKLDDPADGAEFLLGHNLQVAGEDACRSKGHQAYSPPATPCDRLQSNTITAKTKEALNVCRAGLDPVALLRSIREAQSALAAMSSPMPQKTVNGESLDRFLARLPSLWQQGEVRPTHSIRRVYARPGTGGPAKIPSKAFGATCCCGSRRIPTRPPRTCWQNYAKPIRAGSEMLNCERCSAE